MYSVQCTVYNVQCTMYSVQCTVYIEHLLESKYRIRWSICDGVRWIFYNRYVKSGSTSYIIIRIICITRQWIYYSDISHKVNIVLVQ